MSQSMCEAAGLEDGWKIPCSGVEEGEPCRYHQGAEDAATALSATFDEIRTEYAQITATLDETNRVVSMIEAGK